MQLHVIQDEVRQRTLQIASEHPDWPCRKGCADCCRQLASEPLVTEPEWRLIASAIEALPREVADAARQRIRESAGRMRPVVCPLLDAKTDACLIYAARPISCRTYGFYAEREKVLGCSRIEALSPKSSNVIWGNHAALEARMQDFGAAIPLSAWLSA